MWEKFFWIFFSEKNWEYCDRTFLFIFIILILGKKIAKQKKQTKNEQTN
jgi:hypothetical protein